MTIDNFVLNRKYLYVNTELGCDMVGTGGEIYHIPAGYWCFLVEEVLEFFSVSYVSFVCNDFDTTFKAETRDFFVQNLQTPFDLNVSSFVQTIGSISNYLRNIDDYCRIIQNTTSMILSSNLIQNPISNVGALNLVRKTDNSAVAFVPVMSKNFGGTLIYNFKVRTNRQVPEIDTFYPILQDLVGFLSVKCVYSNDAVIRVTLKSKVESSVNFYIHVFDSDGNEYKDIVFGKPVLKKFGLKGGITFNRNATWPVGENNSYNVSRELSESKLLSLDSSISGIVLNGTGNEFSFESDYLSLSGNSDTAMEFNVGFEVPFTCIVPKV